MSTVLDIPVLSGGGALRCPIGTSCRLRVVNRKQMFCECNLDDPDNWCSNALSYGSRFFCRKLWEKPDVKG